MAIIGDKIILDKILVGNIVRNQTESKMELATKGALYVGTGKKNPVTPDGGGDVVNVPETLHIAPNGASDNGKVLVADASQEVGWRIDTCPSVGEWVTITAGTNSADSKITEAGTYEVTVLDTHEPLGFYGTTLVHWDGLKQIAQSVYTNTNLDSSNNTVALYTTHVVVRLDGTLVVQGFVLQKDNNSTAKWNYGEYAINKYKFRKVF